MLGGFHSQYGDIDELELEAEVYASWTRLKIPKTNEEIVNFIDTIEDGMALLESLDKKNGKVKREQYARMCWHIHCV